MQQKVVKFTRNKEFTKINQSEIESYLAKEDKKNGGDFWQVGSVMIALKKSTIHAIIEGL